MAVAVPGVRGTGTFAADERPQNWREKILMAFPNGDAPLTALLSRMREQPTDDPQFNWFEKGLPIYRGIVIGANTTVGSKPADNAVIASGGDDSAAITVKPDGGAEDDLTWLKVGHILLNETTGELMQIVAKGADFVDVERDIGARFATNPALTGNTSTGDPISVVGSAFPEGAAIGAAFAYQPSRFSNYTQIFRTAMFVTRTAARTKLRYDATGPLREARREALQIHATEMERAFLFGEKSERTAGASTLTLGAPIDTVSTGLPMRTTRGIVNWLPTATTATVSIHTNLTSLNSGGLTEDIADSFFEEIFRFGSSEKLAFCGSTALNVLNQLAKNKMTIQAVPTDRTYGLRLMELISPFGTLMLKQHPLMSHNPTWRKDMIVIDPQYITYRYVDDTKYLKNRQSPGDDATKDEFLTEAGLEVNLSGSAPDTGGGLPATTTPAVHGRLQGMASYVG